jgi:hypothetical protein
MKKKFWPFAASMMLFLPMGCAPQQTAQEIAPQPTEYPFTQVMGDYYVRLVVDHVEGEMFLLFENVKEEPVELLRLEGIESEATLPDGAIRREIFQPTEALEHKFIHRYHRHLAERLACCYMVKADWLKTTPNFDLKVKVPFEGQMYDLEYEYRQPKE